MHYMYICTMYNTYIYIYIHTHVCVYICNTGDLICGHFTHTHTHTCAM